MKQTTKPNVSKNRSANEFRERAHALRADLMDPEKTYSAEEVEKITNDIRAFEARAAAAAEFTPEAEIERQGGTGTDLVRTEPNADAAEQGRAEFTSGLTRATSEVRALVQTEFRSFGHYLRAVFKPATATPREQTALRRVAEMTRAITGESGGGAEVLLPLEQVAEIFSVSNVQMGVMQFARRYSVAGRTLRIPTLVQDTGSATLNRPMAGSIANVSIVGEGSAMPAREPQFTQRLLTAYKYAAITEIGDEVLDDDFTGELPSEVTVAVGQQVMNAINEHVTRTGTGTAMPLGALHANNAAALTVQRATANNIGVADVFDLYTRHTHGPNSRWLVSRRAIKEIFELQASNNTLIAWLANLRDKPTMMLLGIPVEVSDLLAPLGTRGDLALVNGDFYAVGLRKALTAESSIHAKFTQGLTTYRFLARAGGIPIPTATYAYEISGGGSKVDEHSPFTVLGDPAA